MKKSYLFLLFAFITLAAQSQTYQFSIGGPHTTSAFNSVKYDPHDGGTIHGGYIIDSSKSNDRNCFLVKLDKHKKIVWQKTMNRYRFDEINKVIICKNGDYIAVGVITVYIEDYHDYTLCGLVWRIKGNTGETVWEKYMTYGGGAFNDVIETTEGDIAVVSGPSPSSLIGVLDSNGATRWLTVPPLSYYQSKGGSPTFTLTQLPNSHLLVAATEIASGNYNLILMEMAVKDGALIAENTYPINRIDPGGGAQINSLVPMAMYAYDGQVSLACAAFSNKDSSGTWCLFKYHTDTKELTGNLYYHPGDGIVTKFNYIPAGKNDFLICESYQNLKHLYISKVKYDSVIYDYTLTNPEISLRAVDTVKNGGVVFSGNMHTKAHKNSYSLFTSKQGPSANTCGVTAANTLSSVRCDIHPAFTYRYPFNGGVYNNAANQAYIINATCTKTIICSDEENVSSSNIIADVVQPAKEKLFMVSPNPATANIHFNIPFSSKPSTLNIYNSTGTEIFKQQLQAGITSENISVSTLASGVYYANLINNDKRLSLQFIKE